MSSPMHIFLERQMAVEASKSDTLLDHHIFLVIQMDTFLQMSGVLQRIVIQPKMERRD